MAGVDYYLIGTWRFLVQDAILRDGQTTRPLEDRAARTLAVLCRRRGETVSRDELLAEVWQGRIVSSNSVAIVIGDLRRALDDDARRPAHLVTIAKQGYRLNAEPAQPPEIEAFPGHQPPDRTARRYVWGVAAAVAVLFGLLMVSLPARYSHLQELVVAPVSNDTGVPSYQPLASALSAVVTDRVARFGSIRMIAPEAKAAAHGAAPALQLVSRLILWNGVPELALKAIDGRTGTVLWSGFAAGGAAELAHSTSLRLDELDRRLDPDAWRHNR